MPEHVDKLGSLVRIKLQHVSLTAINHVGCMLDPCSFGFSNLQSASSFITISFQVESTKSSCTLALRWNLVNLYLTGCFFLDITGHLVFLRLRCGLSSTSITSDLCLNKYTLASNRHDIISKHRDRHILWDLDENFWRMMNSKITPRSLRAYTFLYSIQHQSLFNAWQGNSQANFVKGTTNSTLSQWD